MVRRAMTDPGRRDIPVAPMRTTLGVVALSAALTIALALPAAAAPTTPPTSPPDGGTTNAELNAAQAHLATIDAQLPTLQKTVAMLQAKVKTQSARLTAATDAASAADSRLDWATSLLASGEEGGSVGASRLVIVVTAARAAVQETTARAYAIRTLAASTRFLPRLFKAQASITRLQADRVKTQNRIDALLEQLRVIDTGANAPAGATHIAYGDWAGALLSTLGLPTCGNNLAVMVAWQVAESTDAMWNPLASTHTVVGATKFNSVGVKNYPSLETGLEATAQTLWGGYYRYGYGWILFDLNSCADPMITAQAINSSAWCYGCADGTYVTGIVPKVEANYEAYAGL
jgi:hypothetical protein